MADSEGVADVAVHVRHRGNLQPAASRGDSRTLIPSVDEWPASLSGAGHALFIEDQFLTPLAYQRIHPDLRWDQEPNVIHVGVE